jgi:hypothetical protein
VLSRITKRRPSAAIVIASISLFVALGGVGYAAATIRSGNIVDDAVVSADIKGGGGATGTIKNRDMYRGIALFKGFATVRAGSNQIAPTILNAGGQQTRASGTTVQRVSTGIYRVTFNADQGTGGYSGVNSRNQIAGIATVQDTDGPQAEIASLNNDNATLPAPTGSQVVIEVIIADTAGNLRDRDFTVGFMTNLG